MRECYRIKTPTIGRMIIIAALAHWGKSGVSIHRYRRVPIADFEMDAHYAVVSRAFHKIVEQAAADAATMMRRCDRQQQQL